MLQLPLWLCAMQGELHTQNEIVGCCFPPPPANNRGLHSSERGKQIAFHPGYFLHTCQNIFEVQLNDPYPCFTYNLWKRTEGV